jgi:hypothetical protein
VPIVAAAIAKRGGQQQAGRQYHREKKLMGMGFGYQQQLNQQGHDLQMDMWNKTNYGAQMEHMKKAGLNPALMYGGAGQGGQTGSQTGGSAPGGHAAQESAMDVSNMILAMAQAEKLKAEKHNIDKDTELKGENVKKTVEETAKLIAEKLGIEASTVKTIQETTNLKTVNEWDKVRKGLDELRESKKVTGSAIVDLMTSVGLDPVLHFL